MKKSYLYSKEKGFVRCQTCSHECTLKEGERGLCGVRVVVGGDLFVESYGKIAAINIDRIEKKPLFHFFPGKNTLSLASEGCSLSCLNCQNWELSQSPKRGIFSCTKLISPNTVVKMAKESNLSIIAYTYTDPTSFYEYTIDTMKAAKLNGLKNVLVTHGFMSKEAAKEMSKLADAVNIDIKSFSEDFYREVCGAHLSPVLENAVFFKKSGVWVEITTLVIPGYSDDLKGLKEIANFIYCNLGSETPWHITRFSPKSSLYLKDVPVTPLKIMKKAHSLAKEVGLKYVYIGNTSASSYGNTYCPRCDALCVSRDSVSLNMYTGEERCLKCNYKLDICL